MSRLLGYLAVAAMLVVGSSACSEDDELSFEDWQDQVTAVCDEYEPLIDALDEEHGAAAGLSAVEAFLVDAIELSTEYTDALIAVGVPSERAGEVESLYADLQASEELAGNLLAAVRAEEPAEIESINEELGSASEDLNDRAHVLGVPACDSRAR